MMEPIKIELIVEANKGQIKIPPIVVPDDWEYTLCLIRLSESKDNKNLLEAVKRYFEKHECMYRFDFNILMEENECL